MWAVGPKDSTADIPRITYGETPQGFEIEQQAKPLKPGCYQATISGSGKTRFEVQASGAITEKP